VGGRVAVFGGGPLGLLTALRAIDLGAAEVTVIDRNPTVVASVKSFGFTTELTGEYDAVVEACGAKAVLAPAFKVRSACSTPSVSQPFTNTTFSAHASMWLFSASYYPPPPTHPHTHTHTHHHHHLSSVDLLLQALRTGGSLVLVGLVHPDSDLAGISAESIIRKCLTIVGVHNYTPTDLHNTVPFIIKVWGLHTAAFEAAGLGESAPQFPLRDIATAVDTARDSVGRVLLVPTL
jgi:threonine dehydrogenase-like Zn-dependent dehydrogenase